MSIYGGIHAAPPAYSFDGLVTAVNTDLVCRLVNDIRGQYQTYVQVGTSSKRNLAFCCADDDYETSS